MGKGDKKKKDSSQKKSKNKTKKTTKKPAPKPLSELRQDLVTGDWVVIAAARKNRPFDSKKIKNAWGAEDIPSEEDCIFCDPEGSGQEPDVLIYETKSGDWTLRVFPNKYPAFARPRGRARIKHKEEGPYFLMDGVGYNEVIVTRNHRKHIGKMDPIMVAEVIDAFQTRYLDLMNRKSVRYIEIFHNHGKAVGGSIFHPHSQLAAIPVISPYIRLELNGAKRYHRANKECVYCTMIEWELEKGNRVVFENNDFIVFCPFASRASFEMWVMPKKHSPYFERMSDEEKVDCGEALHEAIKRMDRVLNEPAFNFYLHTSPCDGKDYPHFHWHIEILPKTSIWAGFELSTGIEIAAVAPETAAEDLRKAGYDEAIEKGK